MFLQKIINNLRNVRIKIDFFDCIFLLGIFFVPFDNVWFAPSSGWAAIAPIFFLIYIVFNCKYLILSLRAVKIVVPLFLLSLLNYIVYPFYFPTLIDTLISLILGISFYLSLNIFLNKKNRNVSTLLKIICIAYTISFIYGVLSVTNLFSFNTVRAMFEKRHYDRLQFTFTEPSFVSMHVYGVMLPLTIIFKKNREADYIKILILLFCGINIIFGESARFIVDLCVVSGIGIIYLLIKSKLKLSVKITVFLVSILLCGFVFFIVRKHPRIAGIIENGVYADASLASRWFRMNAILKGFLERPINFLFGFGLSNTHYPFNFGYDAAVMEYRNEYLVEVIQLKNTVEASFFCGHLRVISDFGFVFYLPMLVILYRKSKNKFLFWLMVYLYLQFDSFAFYAFWLLLYNCKSAKAEKRVTCYAVGNEKNAIKSNSKTCNSGMMSNKV